MKAIVYQNFGSPDILRFEEIDKPTPADNEVLIKVRAASINPLDWKLMKGGPFIMRLLLALGKPKLKRPGVGVAGAAEADGRHGTQVQPGDLVFRTGAGAYRELPASRSGPGMEASLV